MDALSLHPYTYEDSQDPLFPIEQIVQKIVQCGNLEDLFSRIRALFGTIHICSSNQVFEGFWQYTDKTIYINPDQARWDDLETRISKLSKLILFESINALNTSSFIKLRKALENGKISEEQFIYRFEWCEFRALKARKEKIGIGEEAFLNSFPHHILWQELTGHMQRIDPSVTCSFFPHPIQKKDTYNLKMIGYLYYSSVVKGDIKAREELCKTLALHKDDLNVRFFVQESEAIHAAWKKRFSWLK